MARIAKMALASLFVLTTLIVPAKADAFGYFFGGTTPVPWATSTIRWCITENNYWSTSLFPSTFTSAAEHWDDKMDRRSIEQSFGTSCEIEVHVVDFSAKGWPNVPARATVSKTSNGLNISDADVYFNSDQTSLFWFSTSHHWCTVVCADRPHDLYTMASHEFGHALGLGHNTENTYCYAGGDTEEAHFFCSNQFYSLDVMYGNAGDGYRRWITEDTRRGLVALGYRW